MLGSRRTSVIQPTPTHRIPSLDGLRALSILLVIVGHLIGERGFIGMSIFGVHVFFVISGYLITTLLQEEYARNSRISVAAFYRRRCFRILPAAYTYILMIGLFWPPARPGLIYAATYTVSYHLIHIPILFQHLWSLSVEEQFYILWPLAFVFGFRHRALIAWIAMAAAAAFRLYLALAAPPFAVDYMHFSFPGTMDSIAAGCLLAVYEPAMRQRFSWMSEPASIAIALPLAAWTLGGVCWGDSQFTGFRMLSVFWGIVPLLIALWISLLVKRNDWIFNNSVASAVGILSYSLYLWQQPFTVERSYTKFVSVLLLGVCSTASYFLVEKPFLKLGAALRPRHPATALGQLDCPARK
jgi:peptidoglycan/LPS O-acetylase OafA/YrhL